MSVDAAISRLVSRLESVTARLETLEKQIAEGGQTAAPTASSGASGADSPSLREFDDLISQHVNPLVELSGKLGDSAGMFLEAVKIERGILETAASSQKPGDDVFQQIIKPLSDVILKIVALRDANRPSKFFNHLSAISEGVPALNWICVSPTPAPFVGDMRAGSEFYSNRILKEFKGKRDQTQVEWVQALNGFLKELQQWIKQHHTTGLLWNPKGAVAKASAAPSSSAAPPAPGPPPPPVVESGSGGAGPDMSGVFSALSKGEAVTSGLKKVTADMKTKNMKDRPSGVVPAATPKPKATAPTAAAPKATKPPKTVLVGNKWEVEHHVNNSTLVIDGTEPKHTCYIFKCNNCTIQVKGKVNAITLGMSFLIPHVIDDCSKTAVVFDTVVASFEVVNCRSVEVQVTGKVPSFAVDKTSGCQIFLSKDSLEAEIITSKSSEMNVLLPTADGDVTELPVPEQYKTVVKDGKLVTECVQHV